jgi:3-isopropylmalate/(R)-2-methylmalate dehydratase small subunit
MTEAMPEQIINTLIRRGTCHVVGDNVSLDDGIIPARFATQRVTDPSELLPHLFETIDADFAKRVKTGDIVLAGRNFASGKPRLQGFIAMGALDLAVVCMSMPYKMLRRSVARAIPVIVDAPEPSNIAATGDEIEIDFATGAVWNLTRDMLTIIPAMPPILRNIVAGGGMQAMLKDWLVRHPEQALQQ